MQTQEPEKIILDFSQFKNLNEGLFRFFANSVKQILMSLLGDVSLPVQIKGDKSQVESFAKAIGREKKYIESIKDYGLNNPKTFKDKKLLDKAVSNFERKTGLKWPFK